jgi:LemA protein
MYKVVIGMLALLLVSTCGYNTLRAKEAQTTLAWNDLGYSCRQRVERAVDYMEAVQRHVPPQNKAIRQVEDAVQMAVREGCPAMPPESPERLIKFRQVQTELTLALARLHLFTGDLPALMRDEGYVNVQKRMEAAENRLNEAITGYNLASHDFNVCKRSFPNSLTNILLLRYSDKEPFNRGEKVELYGRLDS